MKASDEAIEEAVNSLRSQGFINYYGTQRFGTSTVATHRIGKELLRSQWQEVGWRAGAKGEGRREEDKEGGKSRGGRVKRERDT